ncbi:hypothetical protein F4779DRAFT_620901 [Xylariaceae sp. FL0662B]|nr:hypothetical protein F4779DRAFT_620901 [Xylariaceae sp. FL0662B]
MSSVVLGPTRCDLCQKTIEAIKVKYAEWMKNNNDIPKWVGIDTGGLPTLFQGTALTTVGHFYVSYQDKDQIAALKKAKDWLDRCVDEDAGKCSPVLTDLLPIEYKFASLSYRWGVKKEDIVRTTIDNLENHLKSIDLSTLPQTIVDAVNVCWELDIPYLWVDSLCIIQPRDNRTPKSDPQAMKDFKEEGGRMHIIYGSSWVTIFAEDAVCCTAGFLGDCKFGVATNKSDFDHLVSDDSGHEELEPAEKKGSMLSSRGWCLQGYLASNRRLMFHEAEISLGGTVEDHVSMWQKIVEDYTEREVESPEINKLMAISALAKIIEEKTGDGYLYGLWNSKILDGVAWKTLTRQPRRGYGPIPDVAPTWSWAAIDGPVAFCPHPSKYHSSNHHMVKTYNTKYDKGGQSADTKSLILDGPLLPVQLASLQEEDTEEDEEEGEERQSLRPICLVRPQNSNKIWKAGLDFDDVEGIVKLESAQVKARWEKGSCECQTDMPCALSSHQFFALRLHTWEDKPDRRRVTVRRGRRGDPTDRRI